MDPGQRRDAFRAARKTATSLQLATYIHAGDIVTFFDNDQREVSCTVVHIYTSVDGSDVYLVLDNACKALSDLGFHLNVRNVLHIIPREFLPPAVAAAAATNKRTRAESRVSIGHQHEDPDSKRFAM